MSNTKYICRLTPLGEYFLGGKRTFAWADDSDAANPYFIKSESMPSQATLLGVVRYAILEANACLGFSKELEERQKKLIGEKGFELNNQPQGKKNYGVINSIGPCYIWNGKYHLGQTPCDHKEGEKQYSPFEMSSNGYYTNHGKNTILPVDFAVKDGVADSLVCIETGEIVDYDEIFIRQTHTRVDVNKEEDGFFKKEYVRLQDGYSFEFEVELCADNEILLPADNTCIVHMGQEKSAFALELKVADSNINYGGVDGCHKPSEGYIEYYLESDSYIADNVDDIAEYAVTKASAVRTMTAAVGTGRSGYRNKGIQFYMYRKGSVFYVDRDKAERFEQAVSNEAMEQIGYNKYHILGGNK